MQTTLVQNALATRLLSKLQQRFSLTNEQLAQVEQYSQFLLEENKKYNLTGHRELSAVLSNLFADSFEATAFVDFNQLACIADVGTGAGFPGLALKIAFPHLKVLLIEVNQKKIHFLTQCIKMLGLEGVELVCQDWRTFLRHNAAVVDLFVTKATFDELEACRMFRQTSLQKDKALLYWTTAAWQCEPTVAKFCQQEFAYVHSSKALKFALFSANANQNLPFLKKKSSDS